MPAESTLLLAGLFLLAAASGWFFARFTVRHRIHAATGRLSADYFKGLNFLLNEQPDKAIEVFVRMSEVDDETVETHFALGSLFRRRGEVDRAIRIHQNIIARPNLGRAQRDQALFALGEDYLRAGLFDRAEKLFQQLAEVPAHRLAALEKLISIYELQKDWIQAIQIQEQIDAVMVSSKQNVIAHYYCERADEAKAVKDLKEARQLLKKARSGQRATVRAAMMRAAIAAEMGEHKLAAKLYRKVIDEDAEFLPEVLPSLAASTQAQGAEDSYSKLLTGMIRSRPELKPLIAYSVIVDGDMNDPVARRCVREFVRQNETLHDLFETFNLSIRGDDLNDDMLDKIAVALRRLARKQSRYACQECGFSIATLFWQCPTCKAWETIRPIRHFRFEAVLDAASGPPDQAASR